MSIRKIPRKKLELPLRMPYGKYVAMRFTELPIDYLSWLIKNLSEYEPVWQAAKLEFDARFTRAFLHENN